MVLKEMILQQFTILGGCGGLARTDFSTVSPLGGFGGLEITAFLTVCMLGRVWWS